MFLICCAAGDALFAGKGGHGVEAVEHGQAVEDVCEWENQEAVLVDDVESVHVAWGVINQHTYCSHEAFKEEIDHVNNYHENDPGDNHLMLPFFSAYHLRLYRLTSLQSLSLFNLLEESGHLPEKQKNDHICEEGENFEKLE